MMTWPNKTQRRVLRELAEVTIIDDSHHMLERESAEPVGPVVHNDQVSAA